jgi:hypothetical protein
MSSFESFWKAKHNQLESDYVDESGMYAQSCGLLAKDIAYRLQKEGKIPHILALTSVEIDSINNTALSPLPYVGKISWGGHQICIADGMVYDPILEKPEPWQTYSDTMFGKPVASEDISWLIDKE